MLNDFQGFPIEKNAYLATLKNIERVSESSETRHFFSCADPEGG